MTTRRIVPLVAARQVSDVLRRLVRHASGGRVSPTTGLSLLMVLGAALAGALTVQAVGIGRQLGRGYGPGLIAALLSAGGVAIGMTAVVATHIWSRSTAQEREKLAVLPLGGWRLSLLAAVPSLLPTGLALLAALPSVTVLWMTTGIGLASVLGALSVGAAVLLACAAVWTLPMVVLRPRRDLTVVVLTALTVAALGVHALWSVARLDDDAPGPWRLNPMVGVLQRSDPYRWPEAVGAAAALTLSAGLLLLLRRQRRTQSPRRLASGRVRSTGAPMFPPSVRVWLGIVRVIWRQSSLVSEIGVAALIGAGLAYFAAAIWAGGHEAYGRTAIYVAAGFAALPLLGLRSALGATHRLTQLGLPARDLRVGLVGAAVLFFGLSALPGVGVLVWKGATPAQFLVAAALAAIPFSLGLACGSVMRSVTATSLGRSAAVGVCMTILFGLLRLGLTSWSTDALVAAAVSALLLLVAVLTMSVTQRQVT